MVASIKPPAAFWQGKPAVTSVNFRSRLIGGEVNSEIEHAAGKAGAVDAKEKGEKSPNSKKKTKTG